jgi:hypothetical protein
MDGLVRQTSSVWRFVVFVLVGFSGLHAPAADGDAHPWRPPFGLDRVGQSAVTAGLEADAEAHPEPPTNPVDLGTVLVPHGWLLLGPQQRARVRVAALSHSQNMSATVRAWFQSDPARKCELSADLMRGVRWSGELPLDRLQPGSAKDILRVAIMRADGELWAKSIPVMYVPEPPKLPRFGAVQLKLRYDLPISVNSGEGGKLGKLTFIPYDQGWDESLQDVVVCLPNGSRFVFWRGASYIPFWAGANNTGICYEWAETTPPAGGFVDSVEPLMDKELRYGRVEIIESTPARVHVRWTYQSTDFLYKVFGDHATEDFYFYPDGFGTRVLTLKRRPEAEYELSEFIILSAPGAYPLSVVPTNAVEMLYLNGEKHPLSFPPGPDGSYDPARHRRPVPVLYAIRAHQEDRARAVYFQPSPLHYPAFQFGPFYDKGQLVTPAYWGSHWPLSRGKSTGAAIDDRIALSPAHNSLLTWAMTNRPPALTRAEMRTLDTLGQSKVMIIERWAWLIGMSEATDSQLRAHAQSFLAPPSIHVEGADIDFEACVPERRAIRLRALGRSVRLRLEPKPVTVNPVFELIDPPGQSVALDLNGRHLAADLYAWDGKTLWLNATLTEETLLQITFR